MKNIALTAITVMAVTVTLAAGVVIGQTRVTAQTDAQCQLWQQFVPTDDYLFGSVGPDLFYTSDDGNMVFIACIKW